MTFTGQYYMRKGTEKRDDDESKVPKGFEKFWKGAKKEEKSASSSADNKEASS